MIEMKNNTPFPLLSFEKYGRYGLLFDVIAIKMSLRIKNGFYADLAEFQKELSMSDEYYGESETSSLKSETDLVLCKRNTDIHVTGSAHAPSGDKSQWKACVRVNSFSKELSLSGVRYLQYERNRWQMSLPDKIINVPLRYELAYGGIWQPDGMEKLVFSANPVGCGYYPDISQLNTSCQTLPFLMGNLTFFKVLALYLDGGKVASSMQEPTMKYGVKSAIPICRMILMSGSTIVLIRI